MPSGYAMGWAHAGWASMGICLAAWRAAGGRVCCLVHGGAFCAGYPCWLACSHLAAALSTAHTSMQPLPLPPAPCLPAATDPRHAGAVAAFCEEIAAFATGIAKRCHERAAAARQQR